MENIKLKTVFLKNTYTTILETIDENEPQQWGKMNVRQMIEHMSDYVRIASGLTPMDVITPEDRLPKMQQFLMSEKPFPENTPNVLMSEIPSPLKHQTKKEAIIELRNELDYFFKAHEVDLNKETRNPFFGILNFEMQVQLLFKHATHHLRQFGIDTTLFANV